MGALRQNALRLTATAPLGAVPLGAALVALAGLWLGPTASASIGVGIQANPVLLSGVAHPGGSYALPPLYVINTGTQAETISVQVEPGTSGGTGLSVPQSWIHIASLPGSLAPRQSAQIPLQLVTPGNARPGSYAGDIMVTGGGAVTAGGARFSAAAATGLQFRVTPGPGSAIPAWRWWLGGALLAAGVIALAIRRSGLRLRIERRGFLHSGGSINSGGPM
jgi:hypothetical protein